jgi:hypothetical protein
MTRRRLFLLVLAGGTVAFSLLFALAFREDLDRHVARPLLEAYTIAKWFFAQFHQGMLWGALVLVGGYFAFRSHVELARATPARTRHRGGRRKGNPTELERLTTALRRAAYHPMARAALVHELASTAALLVANREGLPREVARQRVADGTWHDAPGIRDFLRVSPSQRGPGVMDKAFNDKLAGAVALLERYAKGA